MAEARSDHNDRSKAARIERIRRRLEFTREDNVDLQVLGPIISVIKGILDLLDDEL